MSIPSFDEGGITLYCENAKNFMAGDHADFIFTQVYEETIIRRHVDMGTKMVLVGRPGQELDHLWPVNMPPDWFATFIGEMLLPKEHFVYAINCSPEVQLRQYKCDGKCFFALAFCVAILDQVTGPGDLVLDPCMGRGTVGKACKMLGRKFIGVDKNPERVKMAEEYIWSP